MRFRESTVTRSEAIGEHLLARHPRQLSMLDARRFPLDLNGEKLDDEIGTGVGDGEGHGPYTQHPNVQLLRQLSARSLQIALSSLNLPTGKLPEVAVPFVNWPLAQKHTAVASDDGCDNADRHRRGLKDGGAYAR